MTADKPKPPPSVPPEDSKAVHQPPQVPADEIGGPKGPEPTRYEDWERGGRCIDF